MVNTTRLLRRIAKYLDANSGGRKQTGETAFGLAAVNEAQFIRRIRNGSQIGQDMLEKADKFLTEAGY